MSCASLARSSVVNLMAQCDAVHGALLMSAAMKIKVNLYIKKEKAKRLERIAMLKPAMTRNEAGFGL